MDETALRVNGSPLPWIANMVRKFNPFAHARPSVTDPLQDIARLAEISPHLIADLGFVEDRHSASPDVRVWRGQGIVIRLHARQTEVQVRHAGA